MDRRAASLSAWLLVILVALAFPAPALAEKRVALVIGIDKYPSLGADRQLQKAVNDAEAMGDALKRLGFEVIRGSNLGRQGAIDKLSEFTARLEPGDTAVFFYAGHGVAIGGVNYLLPADVPAVTEGSESRVRGASIAEQDIISEIQSRGARVTLLVLDACRDNPFPRTAGRSIGNTRGLADARPARGVFTIYSAGIGQTALDRLENNDPNRNSVFTRIFVEQLVRPGLHLSDLAVEVRERVAELALKAKDSFGGAAPHEQTPAYYDQTLGGRIYLAGRDTAADSKSATPAVSGIDPAAQAWAITQNTTSVAVLEEFIRQFGSTVYARMARARLDEIKKSQAVVPPAAVAAPSTALAALPARRETAPPTSSASSLLRGIDIGPSEKPDPTPATECDRLTTWRVSWEKAPGIAGGQQIVLSELPRALAMCRSELERYPNSRRLRFLLARALSVGVYFHQSADERRKLYTEAIKLGSADAIAALGAMYEAGDGVEVNFPLAVALQEEAARRGNPQGYANIGFTHQRAENYEEMHRWYERAAAMGSTPAMRSIGYAYRDGRGVEKNFERAEQYFLQALQAGDHWSYMDLGNLMRQRDDGKKSLDEMVKWYEKGIAADMAGAATALAHEYRHGLNLPKDIAKAEKLFARAIELKDIFAYWGLAQSTANADNPARNIGKALAQIDRLAEFGIDADFYRGMLYEYDIKDPVKALESYRASADANPRDPAAAERVGTRYFRGLGTPVDLQEACRWFERAFAIDQKTVWALARFHANGRAGFPVNPGKAAELLLLGIAGGEFDTRYKVITKKGVDISYNEGDANFGNLGRDVVIAMQQKLRALGLFSAEASGTIDEPTLAALRRLRNPFEGITRERIAAAR